MTQAAGFPAELGYRMPAEWEKQSAMWMSWPYNLETWDGHLEGAEKAFTEIITHLSHVEHVHLLVPDAAIEKRAKKNLEASPAVPANISIHHIESGDVWIRDYGPIFIKHQKTDEIAWTDWEYNAYGGKWDDLLIGDSVPLQMPLSNLRRFDTRMILEGGSIDVNGTGSLLTTESCLLSPDRNPTLTKEQIEEMLKAYLGVTNVLWLKEGIAGDDTTGHVDDLTRFVGKSTVVTVVEENSKDENYAPLQENLRRLQHMKDEQGHPLTIIPLPMPKEFSVDGRRMAASYANFLIANGIVLVPTYAQDSDAVALKTLAGCFPDRKVIGIDCRELIWGYGSIHCASQQQPA
ncbi:MAG: agmatine deiminase family protein [Candidatus Peribacteraceae bacterium]